MAAGGAKLACVIAAGLALAVILTMATANIWPPDHPSFW
jgi:hypothetical protein